MPGTTTVEPSAGWSADDIDELCRSLAPVHQSAVFRWLGSELGARQLLDEIQRSGRAISDIVRAVKSYAYLDQAAIQDVDVPTTLNDTLMILKHKLRDVEIVRDYEPDLPRIEVHAGEINQVWTNLIDNAVDAMAGRGTVTIPARRVTAESKFETDSASACGSPDASLRLSLNRISSSPFGGVSLTSVSTKNR